MASGLLTLGVGQGTKLLTFLVGADKRYSATIRLGQATTSDDAEGEHSREATVESLDGLDEARIAHTLEGFVGNISQVPSAVSAVKIDGKRAYERVRAGEQVNIPARSVTIHSIVLRDCRRVGPLWDTDVEVHCSSGTYIRAIARDLGDRLGVGGHLTALRRTTVGPFSVEDACAPDEITADRLQPLAAVASQVMDTLTVSHAQAVELGHGKKVFLEPPEGVGPADPLGCVDQSGRLVAIVSVDRGVSRILVGFPDLEGDPT